MLPSAISAISAFLPFCYAAIWQFCQATGVATVAWTIANQTSAIMGDEGATSRQVLTSSSSSHLQRWHAWPLVLETPAGKDPTKEPRRVPWRGGRLLRIALSTNPSRFMQIYSVDEIYPRGGSHNYRTLAGARPLGLSNTHVRRGWCWSFGLGNVQTNDERCRVTQPVLRVVGQREKVSRYVSLVF
jgi:hypothetical protein